MSAVVDALRHGSGQTELVGKLVQQADAALLATLLCVVGLGLFSLFVDDTISLPS